ncbi:hypothetical protein BDN72DRAFT_835892 [Pluteus cervinus]|uniref:Uncharacterized protein n=1 Tax=Pluteus cervinus TaxID=181527 RepID=A0ACD3B4L0_9AGAR|nr:hypothetical protein BDN72DRAFT_835892 [Pluteus cervinus]
MPFSHWLMLYPKFNGSAGTLSFIPSNIMAKGTSDPPPRHSTRNKHPSSKQIAQENEKLQEQIRRQQAELAQLKRQQMKQKTKLHASDDEEEQSSDGFEPESEDEQVPGFTSSAVPLQTLGYAAETQPLRHVVPGNSSHLPHRVASSSPETPEPAAGNTNDELEEGTSTQHKRPHSPVDSPGLDDCDSPPPLKRPTLDTKLLSRPPRKQPPLNPGVNEALRPKTSDYGGTVKSIIQDTIRRYEANIVAVNAYPEEVTKSQWVVEFWAQACKKANDEYELTPRVHKLIESRASRIRSAMLNEPAGIRVLVHHHFLFDDNEKGDIEHNTKLHQELLREGTAFAYEDTKTMSGFMRNKIFIKELRWIFQGHNKHSLGLAFSHLFNPVSLPTLALLMTMTYFCIKEFETGTCIKKEFNEDSNWKDYQKYLGQLTDTWYNSGPETVKKYCATMSKKAGATVAQQAPNPSTMQISVASKERIAAELKEHSGDTDSDGG